MDSVERVPVPEFVVELRRKIGHDRLWLTGLCAVVTDDQGRLLLTHRADTGRWALPSGVLEPGEQPAPAIVREIAEETRVHVEVTRLAAVVSDRTPFTLPNGDICQYLTLTFACRYLSGTAAVGDDENTAVAWFPLDGLPQIDDRNRERLRLGLSTGELHFER